MRPELENLLDLQFLGNDLQSYLIFAGISIVAFLVFKIFLTIALKKLEKIAKATTSNLDDFLVFLLGKIQWAAFIIIIILSAKSNLLLSNTIISALNIGFIAIVTYELIKIATLTVDYFSSKIILKKQQDEKEGESTSAQVTILSKVLKVTLWLIGLILFLSNIGYNVTSLIAGLGIGSVAIALAIQNILGDVLSSFSIYFDKPFQVGDFIQVGNYMGTVKNIGIKTTRVQTLQGEELVVPNNKLTNAELQNYGKLRKRRVLSHFGLRYETPTEKVKAAKAIVQKIVNDIELANLDRVHFFEYGESSLNFELVYYVEAPEYATYMDIQEEINLKMKEEFEKQKIDFAYPTRTIIIEKD